jgi:hypothetical protein
MCSGGASSLSFSVDGEKLQGSSGPGSSLGGGRDISISSMISRTRSGAGKQHGGERLGVSSTEWEKGVKLSDKVPFI